MAIRFSVSIDLSGVGDAMGTGFVDGGIDPVFAEQDWYKL